MSGQDCARELATIDSLRICTDNQILPRYKTSRDITKCFLVTYHKSRRCWILPRHKTLQNISSYQERHKKCLHMLFTRHCKMLPHYKTLQDLTKHLLARHFFAYRLERSLDVRRMIEAASLHSLRPP